MSDDAQPPVTPEADAEHGAAPPNQDATQTPWTPPQEQAPSPSPSPSTGPKVSLGKEGKERSQAADSGRTATPAPAQPGQTPAPPPDQPGQPASPAPAPAQPGPPTPAPAPSDAAPSDADPWAPPAAGGPGATLAGGPPSVHDQQTITSLPADGHPARWAAPTAPPSPGAPPSHSTPYPPPATRTNPFAPPGAAAPADPFAPPGPAAQANPFAPPAQDASVPPPPIAPGGPGQVAYGYPGGYGYPPAHGPAAPGYYGWPGMPPVEANGMGTAGLVLGILAAIVFCLWPLAIVLGVLGVIFGAIGRGKAGRGEATNPGQALAGIICGAAGIVLGVTMGVLVFVA
ncbi:DUF4190 domain-containing protein [Streptomyces sp. NPDC001532]|uniref:DUF4190 domain-containing protein n=1 Tax=Streptomyces sp. NPDC001532 TaxID=3154520 RepID=UPI003324F9FF